MDATVPAGKFHRLSCARHLRDIDKAAKGLGDFRFAPERAERFFRFAEKLKHYKGELAGQPIRLEPWQKFTLGSLFAWVHRDTGLRRFRTAYNEVPRKNGKTTAAAAVALYVTFYTNEPGNEGYVVATKRDQARICFNDAKKMVKSSGLKNRIRVHVANLSREDTSSKLEPLGADHDSTDGLNPGFVCVDEMHAMKDRGMLDVMETATGARREPLIFQITTAGQDPVSPCGDQHDYATKILENTIQDETFFAFIAHADADDDWTADATARKANPNYGVSVKPDDMKALVTKALSIPSAAAAYKQKRLGLWVNASAPCLSVDGWSRGQGDWSKDEMLGQACYIGVDLASQIDLCSMSILFPPTAKRSSFRLIQHIWTPLDTILERAHKDRAPYHVWRDQGWLGTTPGTRIDQDVVLAAILKARSLYRIELVGFDPWHADHLVNGLVTKEGFSESKLLAVPQTFAGLSTACLRFQAEVLAGNVDARGCPVTAWSVSNTSDQRDGKDNMQFSKKKSRGRIDPVISAAIAMALWVKQPVVTPKEPQMFFMGARR